MGKRGRVVAVVLALVVLLAVVLVGRHIWNEHRRSNLSRALDLVPSETKRLAFTDWKEVRASLGLRLGSSPDEAAITELTEKSFDNDLSGVSAINDDAVAMQKFFGFSAATADWEASTQADEGQALVVRMPDDFDLDQVRDRLAAIGFTKPGSKDGIWSGGIDLVAALNPEKPVTPELQYVAVIEDKHLVVSSDAEDYLKKAVQVVKGKADSLADVDSVRAVVSPVEDPVSAMVWTRDFACNDLRMSQAVESDQDQADALVAAAGKITPLTGLVMSMDEHRDFTVSELFADGTAAKENLRARAQLAVGEAPGRGGSFSDDLELKSSKTQGSTVQLRFAPRKDTGFLLSALNSNAVLFATC